MLSLADMVKGSFSNVATDVSGALRVRAGWRAFGRVSGKMWAPGTQRVVFLRAPAPAAAHAARKRDIKVLGAALLRAALAGARLSRFCAQVNRRFALLHASCPAAMYRRAIRLLVPALRAESLRSFVLGVPAGATVSQPLHGSRNLACAP